jgi:Uma2 family endonuclease
MPGKAELIGGRIVRLMPTGYRPNLVAFHIARSLDDYARATGRGVVFTDNMGFAVPVLSSGRQSFSPGAAYYEGPPPGDDLDFVQGPPTLAVEVRSKGDHGEAAEQAMTAKRADYFEAGTLVVWDVDLRADCIRSYRSDAPDSPLVFSRDKVAEAEPAVPGWRVAVEELLG